jgi:hypothetical protein
MRHEGWTHVSFMMEQGQHIEKMVLSTMRNGKTKRLLLPLRDFAPRPFNSSPRTPDAARTWLNTQFYRVGEEYLYALLSDIVWATNLRPNTTNTVSFDRFCRGGP